MRVPQVTERMKEAPAHALRAVFAGIGQILLVADRLKNRPGGDDGGQARTAPAAASATAPADAGTSSADAWAAATDAPVTAGAAAPAATAASAPAATASPAADGLPMAGYDDLTLASIRARMRSLDAAQLRDLVGYEKNHAGRAAVLDMFERRIAKIEGGEA